MKKIFLSLMSVLMVLSCSKDDITNPDTRLNSKKMIELNASVESSILRAGPINNNFSANFPVSIYANKSGTWTAGSTNIINNDNATVLGAGAHNITFTGTYYYPIDGSTVNIFAVAPNGAESAAATAGSASTNAPQVTISITNGQQDVMWATASGTKSSVAPVLNFAHRLTQLQFTFISGTGFPAGTTVTSLKLNGQPNTAVVNMQSGVCTFSGTAAMEAIQGSPVSITTTPGTNANSPVMTQAGGAINLDITVQPSTGSPYTYTGIVVPSLTTVMGSAHMITLTFTATQIVATATVAAWANGAGGSVSVN